MTMSRRCLGSIELDAASRMFHRYLVLLLATVAVTASCHELTAVSEPDTVLPSVVNTPAGAVEQRNAAVGAFALYYGNAVVASGLMSDELGALSSEAGQPFEAGDMRSVPDGLSITTSNSPYPYPGLSGARVNSLIAIQALESYDPQLRDKIGELFALTGYVELLFIEQMCDGVPVSTIVNGTPVAGPQTTRTALFQLALSHFDSAAKYAQPGDSIADLAAIGKGRTLLDMDSLSSAMSAVRSVATTYRYAVQYNVSADAPNVLSYYLFIAPAAQISDREGINGLNFVSAGDPRILVDSTGNANIYLGSGIEARLIEAEAALAMNQPAEWLDDLNALRADSTETGVGDLGPIGDPVSSNVRVDSMFTERAFWLFGTGHRLGDLRRLLREYGRNVDAVFPTGAYPLGGSYGNDVNFPVVGERITGPECTNRNP